MTALLFVAALTLPAASFVSLPALPPALPLALPAEAPVQIRGIAMYYETPGLMERIAQGHNAMPALPPGVLAYASSPYVRIQKGVPRYGTVRVTYRGTTWRFRVLFGDESQPYHRAAQIARGLVIELPYQIAHKEGWWRQGHTSAVLESISH